MESTTLEETQINSPTKSSVRPIPEGFYTLTPHLICAGASDAIEFYKKAFGATEMSRLPDSNGKLMHARIRIGDSVMMLLDENPEWDVFGPKSLKGAPITLHLYVEHVDNMFEQAVRAGATAKMPPKDMFWGDRYSMVDDPFGYRWSIATHVRDVTADEMQRAMAEMDCCSSKP